MQYKLRDNPPNFFTLSSGKVLYPKDCFIAISPDLEIGQGRWEKFYPELSQAERVELGSFMIKLWEEYKAKAERNE